jgi:hypothetical protein
LPERHWHKVHDFRSLDCHFRFETAGSPLFEVFQNHECFFFQRKLMHVTQMIAKANKVALDGGDCVIVYIKNIFRGEDVFFEQRGNIRWCAFLYHYEEPNFYLEAVFQ